MRAQNTACRESSLQVLLSADDDSAEYHQLAAHVEECPACQEKLWLLAAGRHEWSEIPEFLLADELDVEVTAGFGSGSWSVETKNALEGSTLELLARQVLEPASHPEMLGRLGRYEIERLIGSGGMGIVFKAFDTELNRPVAIKVLAPHLAGSGAARKRFAREARAVAAVVHEHVVAIHNVESEHEPPFFVMQFVAGESLGDRLNREGPLELCEILRIGFQTAAGLAAAHAQGIVHRDVKPSNILLENQVERALLTDFGLARAGDDASLTHSGCLTGTPHYMSPEQARGESVGVESDLFSLGSVLYAIATGHPPFRAETPYGTLRRITDDAPRSLREQNARVPEWFERIVAKLLSKDPGKRFESAEEVAELLEDCLAHVQQPLSSPLPEFCQPPKAYSNWFSRVPVIVLTVLILIITWATLRPWFVPDGPAETANQDVVNPTNDTGTSSTEAVDPLTEWDRAHEQLEDLNQDAENLEAEISRFW